MSGIPRQTKASSFSSTQGFFPEIVDSGVRRIGIQGKIDSRPSLSSWLCKVLRLTILTKDSALQSSLFRLLVNKTLKAASPSPSSPL